MHNFHKLDVWDHSRELGSEIYLFCAKITRPEARLITAQLRRSALSISANIAEGCGKNPRGALRLHCLRELPHRLLLLRRQLLRHRYLHLDNQVALRPVLLDPVSTHPEAFSVLRARRDLDRDLGAVERLDVDLLAERRVGDADLHRRDEIQPFALIEAVGLHVEGDQQITRRASLRASGTLPLEANLRARVDTGRNGDLDGLSRAHFARAGAGGAALRRHLPATKTDGAGALHGKAARTKADRPATGTFGTGPELCARRGAAAATGRALLVQVELDGDLAAHRRGSKRDFQRCFDVVAALRSTVARVLRAAARAAAEHRTEQVAESAESDVAEVFHVDGAAGARPPPAAVRSARTSAARCAPTAEAAERTEPAQLIVLLPLPGVAQCRIRLRDRLERVGGLGIVRVLVRVVLRRETAVLLLDLGLRSGRRYAEDGVVVLLGSHGRPYAVSRSIASRPRVPDAAAVDRKSVV